MAFLASQGRSLEAAVTLLKTRAAETAELVRKMAERDLQQKFQLLQARLDQYDSGKEELNEGAGDEMNRRIFKTANGFFCSFHSKYYVRCASSC